MVAASDRGITNPGREGALGGLSSADPVTAEEEAERALLWRDDAAAQARGIPRPRVAEALGRAAAGRGAIR